MAVNYYLYTITFKKDVLIEYAYTYNGNQYTASFFIRKGTKLSGNTTTEAWPYITFYTKVMGSKTEAVDGKIVVYFDSSGSMSVTPYTMSNTSVLGSCKLYTK